MKKAMAIALSLMWLCVIVGAFCAYRVQFGVWWGMP